ncbi:MAG: iron-sulfur cluster assembly accessory protein [Planctomycetota bacterium]
MATTDTATDNPVTLTEGAAKEITDIVNQQVEAGELEADKVYLRVGVKGGGCSGFSYMLDLIQEEPADSDEVFEEKGIRVVADMKSLLYLGGVQIDFKDEVMGRGFVFNNPNATSTCGCGSSFTA